MKQYVCVRDEDIQILGEEEITEHLLQGQMFDEIYELGKAMELQIRLVPSKSPRKKNANKVADEAQETKAKTSDEPEADEVAAANGVNRKKKTSKKSTQVEASA